MSVSRDSFYCRTERQLLDRHYELSEARFWPLLPHGWRL
jgi:hypothetical protein